MFKHKSSLSYSVSMLATLTLLSGCLESVDSDVDSGTTPPPPPAGDTTSPTLTITSPADQANVAGTVTITADASDASGIATVEFFANGNMVLSDSTSPYSAQYAPTLGATVIRVVATDGAATPNTSESSITINLSVPPPVDTTPPTVSFASPSNGSTVSAPTLISVNASDASGVARVDIFAGGVMLISDTQAPFEFNWSPVDGSHDLRAVAVDASAAGNTAETTITVTADNTPPGDSTPPAVSIIAPANGADVTGPTLISVTATDASGIARVDISDNGVLLVSDTQAPYETTWTPADGTHNLRAVAVDASAAANSGESSITVQTPGSTGGGLSVSDLGLHEVNHGDTITINPVINGSADICRKDLGHDDVRVDSETGQITWNTGALLHGRGFYIRIKCSNATDSAFASGVIHVDKSGSSSLLVAGQGGVSQFIGTAGRAMSSGDTIVFPDGLYPASVSRDESYENAFNNNAPTSGNSDQFSTIMSRNPGGAVIDGAPHDGIPKAKKAFELSNTNYVAIAGFVVKNVRRESFKAGGGDHLLVEFLGTAGAGTNLVTCDSFGSAGDGWCSQAGFRVNGGTSPLIQNGYNWADNRYGIMMRSTDKSVVRRSIVRLDAYVGDQPYGGHSHYCTTNDMLQDSMAIDSLAIAAPHYKNYAGIAAYPATGCEGTPVGLETVGFVSLNNELHLSLADSKASGTHRWSHIVNWDTEGTCTPQTNRCSAGVLQSDQQATWDRSTTGAAKGFAGGSLGGYFTSTVTATNSSFQDMTSGNLGLALDSTNNAHTVQGQSDQSDLYESLRYLPKAERGSALENKTADLLYHYGKSDTFHGDPEFDTLTTSRRWPIAGEDIIAAQMRTYDNPNALAVGGGTVAVSGNRGAAASGESMSEYIWGYLDHRIPPLVVRVKDKGASNRVAWEPLSSFRGQTVTGWAVLCMDAGEQVLANVGASTLVHNDGTGCSSYAVKASYADGDSGIAYIETPE